MSEPLRTARRCLPSRRRSWTQKVRIEGLTFHVGFGEYDDGRLGEIWIDGRKEGTFVRGINGALARMASMALQCGASVAEVAGVLRHLNFPPNGLALSNSEEIRCSSLCDWIAIQIERYYIKPKEGVTHVGFNS